MTPEERAALLAKAEAAVAAGVAAVDAPSDDTIGAAFAAEMRWRDAARPAVILSLLAALAAAEAERDAVKASVDGLLAAIGYVHVEINDDRVPYPEAQDDPFDYAARLVRDRDAARAEAARLRGEVQAFFKAPIPKGTHSTTGGVVFVSAGSMLRLQEALAPATQGDAA